MRSDFSYQYYFIDFSFEEHSDNDPGYIPKLSRELSAQNILYKFHACQPITELDSESDFLMIRKLQNQICGRNYKVIGHLTSLVQRKVSSKEKSQNVNKNRNSCYQVS